MATSTIPYDPGPQFVVESKAVDNVETSNYLDSSFSISKSGYTAIGVVGFNIGNASSNGANSSYCTFSKILVSGTSAQYRIRTTSSSAARVKITFYVLYKKN